jgi:hypothetical protein
MPARDENDWIRTANEFYERTNFPAGIFLIFDVAHISFGVYNVFTLIGLYLVEPKLQEESG